VVSDPGLTRFRLAVSTLVAVGLSLAVLAGLASSVGQPATSGLLGVVIAMMASTAVTDPTARSRVVTTALIPVPAIAAATCGALLAPFPLIGEAGFVLVMTAAVYVRQFGPRPSALGMISYISYFFALFLHARLGQVPELAVSVIIGAGCSLLVRTVLIRERPEREMVRLVSAVRARLGTVVELAIDAVAAQASGCPGRDPTVAAAAQRCGPGAVRHRTAGRGPAGCAGVGPAGVAGVRRSARRGTSGRAVG
jgi:hypothetical protein